MTNADAAASPPSRLSVNAKEGIPPTDVFMWETFTTKPFHDSGEVKRVGDITTPW